MAQANAQLDLAAIQFHRDYPYTNPQARFQIQPLRDTIVGDVRNSLLVLLVAVSLVLLIACANVANLLLARAAGRRREFAIRSALGAGRARIIRQLFTESILLSLGGGVPRPGARICRRARAAGHQSGGLPRIGDGGSAGIDWRVLGFTLAVSLATAFFFGLFPALHASRNDLSTVLKESSSRSGIGLRQGRLRALLVVSEVSLALVLLIGAILLIRSLVALHGVGPGFDPHNVLTMEMSLTGDRFEKAAGVVELAEGRSACSGTPDDCCEWRLHRLRTGCRTWWAMSCHSRFGGTARR